MPNSDVLVGLVWDLSAFSLEMRKGKQLQLVDVLMLEFKFRTKVISCDEIPMSTENHWITVN